MKHSLIVLLLISLFSCQENSVPEVVEDLRRIDSLEHHIDSLEGINLDLQDELTAMKAAEEPIRGLPFEEEFIISQLKQRKDLFKVEGVLGGSMYYSSVQILNRKWLMAISEDGHIQAASLIRFDVAKDSTLEFTVLDNIEHY